MRLDNYLLESIISAISAESTGAMAEIFLSSIQRAYQTKCKPDRVERRMSISGGRPRLVAIKTLPEPLPSAWGMETSEDVVLVCKADLSDGFPISPEEAMQKEYGFFLLSRQECDEILSLISSFIAYDLEDFSGVRLGALVPLTALDTSPSSEWNERVRGLREKEEALYAEEKEKERRKKEKRRNEVISLIESEFGEIEVIKYDEFFVYFTLNGKKYYVSYIDPDKVKKNIDRFKGDLNTFQATIKEYKENKRPLFAYGTFAVYVKDIDERGNTLIPADIVPHFIGKGGENIKKISRVIGKRVNIIKTDPLSIKKISKVVTCYLPKIPQLPFSEVKGETD